MLCAINNNSMGAKGYHPVMMFKVLLLQSWQNLSALLDKQDSCARGTAAGNEENNEKR